MNAGEERYILNSTNRGLIVSISLYLIFLFLFFLKDFFNAQNVTAVTKEQNTITSTYINDLEEEKKFNKRKISVLQDFQIAQNKEIKELKKRIRREIKISVVGDITIGIDEDYGYRLSLSEEIDKHQQDYRYFVEDVAAIFEDDDLTLANLETTLTTASEKANKKFRFRGKPEYVEILKEGHIEAVNIANNHIYDYFETGFNETLATLEEAKIGYFGYDYQYITTIQGIRIGVLGYEGWEASEKLKKKIRDDIADLKKQTNILITSFHWGNEREYYPSEDQIELGHYAVEQGADLVFGHHPHVIQGIEEYRGKYIVYSLGNFLFGGNKNPSDKDTFIFQQTFHFSQDGKLLDTKEIKLIPCSISSVQYKNDYKPTIIKDDEGARVLKRIEKYSRLWK